LKLGHLMMTDGSGPSFTELPCLHLYHQPITNLVLPRVQWSGLWWLGSLKTYVSEVTEYWRTNSHSPLYSLHFIVHI